jgi:hypothetical protein
MGRLASGVVLLLLALATIIWPGRMDVAAIVVVSLLCGLPGTLLLYSGWRSQYGQAPDAIAARSVTELLAVYDRHPEGFAPGFGDAQARAGVRQIGTALNGAGGMDLMLAVHAEFTRRSQVSGAARNLEHMWDGIGEWRG